MSRYLWTSESVSPGHPDKIADQVSDTVLDAYLEVDPEAKVACEVLVKDSTVVVAGEISSAVKIPEHSLEQRIRACIDDIGYDREELKFCGSTCTVQFLVSEQSREINKAVVQGEQVAAGDQGIMFGYASRETPTHMPLAIYLAKELINEAYHVTRATHPLRPDMKSQVSLVYDKGQAVAIDSIVFSTCHAESLGLDDARELLRDVVIANVMARQSEHIQSMFSNATRLHLNPAGAWNIGGPVSDCGLTGRKIVVDQYGADCEIGGGAFSGKDPSKVDRSAAYMARHLALHTLKANPDAHAIKVQLAYAIGEAEPVSWRIYDPRTMQEYGLGSFTPSDLTPTAIIQRLALRAPIYAATAIKGHFGVAPYSKDGVKFFAWEE
ncbi:MAG: methionine adenosyltransferase [Candidatus Kapabacteria bacterium]|nr:methionine adenosyltransferase [Candidatus Kapabacteria bacterium]